MYFNHILREILFDIEQAQPYFDDILIGADDPWEFIEVVDKVLTRLKDRNGVVSKEKIRLGFEKMVALGFEVGISEYSPLQGKTSNTQVGENQTRHPVTSRSLPDPVIIRSSLKLRPRGLVI